MTGEDGPPPEPIQASEFFWLQHWDDPFLHRAFPPPQGPGFDQVHTEEDNADDSDGYENDDDYPSVTEEEYDLTLDEILGDEEFELDRCEFCNRLWLDCPGCGPEPQVDTRESSSFREHARQVRRRQRRANEAESEQEERIQNRNQQLLNSSVQYDRDVCEQTSEQDTSDEDETGESEKEGQQDEHTAEGQTDCDLHNRGTL